MDYYPSSTRETQDKMFSGVVHSRISRISDSLPPRLHLDLWRLEALRCGTQHHESQEHKMGEAEGGGGLGDDVRDVGVSRMLYYNLAFSCKNVGTA